MTDVVDLSGNNPDATIGKAVKSLGSPSGKLRAVTPSDTADLADGITRAIYVGGAGNVAVIGADDDTPVTFTAPPVGTKLEIRVRRIMATNTTATLLIAMF